ncbi:MAG: ribosome-associated translation inhibitor RaiA [Candidatus Desulfofervidaceae bacterium]|nr:ribosome-associated translation inhibitor RaiA [Candidatus Desulfofervidaceae bacterium]MDL1969403.1 ribosome-associated translation inhibitor RaiA [Candidatus Desulfofervidaceae bacterium]
MQISVTFRNIRPSESIKSYAEKKIGRLQRFLRSDNIEANLVVSVEKFRHLVELNIWADGDNIYGKEEAEDIYAAIDTVMDKVERQISKLKEKKKGGNKGAQMPEPTETPLPSPQIIRSNKFYPKPMDVEEAVNQMEVSGEHILVFINSETNKMCVLHKNEEGHYDLIEPNV